MAENISNHHVALMEIVDFSRKLILRKSHKLRQIFIKKPYEEELREHHLIFAFQSIFHNRESAHCFRQCTVSQCSIVLDVLKFFLDEIQQVQQVADQVRVKFCVR